ncbi:PREDICTED: zinc finger protein 62 homolog [Habropoda laboriosa]|uniref:zinc finger protein 62 homolog n=1 Tax=Habropoda laboriosa TaxID=597456 RepID=UPI00083DC5C2|nr:PREDICTED: zinc finger protein 62 homolog [Habropoda laboriosa]
MARAIIYKRSVDAVLVDIQLDKLDPSNHGIKIKEEPFDPDILTHDDSSSMSKNGEDQSRIATPEDESSDVVNFTEGKQVSAAKSSSKVIELRSCSLFERNRRSELERMKKRQRVVCNVCLVSFEKARGLVMHRLFLSRPFMCDNCHKSFTSQTNYALHKITYQSSCGGGPGPKPRYVCNFCERGFFRRSLIQSHLFHQHGDAIHGGRFNPGNIVEHASMENVNEDSVDTGSEMSKDSTSTKWISTPTMTVNNLKYSENTPRKKLNSPLSRNLIKSCGTPSKKMKQTTLTDFISFCNATVKNERSTPENLTDLENISGRRPETPDEFENDSSKLLKDIEMSTPVKCPETDMLDSKKPFVRIHMYPNLIMSFLSKNITSPTTPTTSRSTPYNFRQTRAGSNNSTDPESPKSARESRKRKRNAKKEALFSLEKKIRTTCKDCAIYLERCDKVAKTNVSQSVSQQVESERVEENSEEVQKTNLEGDASLKAIETPSAGSSTVIKPCKNEPTTAEQQSDLHEKEVKPKLVRMFRCNLCDKFFLSQENMREHKELFHVIYMSSICNARFKTMSLLLRHYWRQHLIPMHKKCCVCDEKFDSTILLKQHLVLHCVKTVQSKKDTLPVDIEPLCNVFKKRHRCKGCLKRFWLKVCLTQHEKVCRRMKTRTTDKQPRSSSVSIEKDNEKSSSVVDKKQAPSVPPNEQPAVSPNGNTQYRSKIDIFPLESHNVVNKRLINGMAYAKGYQVNAQNDAVFPCTICDKQFRTFPNLCMHERTFCKPLINRCNTCGTAFPTKKLLQIHMLAAHTASNAGHYKFICQYCNQGFVKRMNLQIHERHLHVNTKVLQNTDRIFSVHTICSVCNLMFESYERFVQHNMYYYQGQTFACTFCSESFQGMYLLHHHYKVTHRPDNKRQSYIYTCDVCNEMFSYDSHLHAHKWHVHLHNEPSVQNTLNTMQDHSYALTPNMDVSAAESAGLPVKMYGCNVCDLHFTNTKDLLVHKVEYSADGDFECKGCHRRCHTSSILARHQCLSHTDCESNSTYKCCFCGEVLTTSISIMCHDKHFHTNNVDPSRPRNTSLKPLDSAALLDISGGTFNCWTCDSKFKTPADLKQHLLEYSDIGAFSCSICHRKFSNCYVLEVHKLKHSTLSVSLFRHRCPLCNEGFTCANNVRVHVMHLHRYEIFGNNNVKMYTLTKLPNGTDTIEQTAMFIKSMTIANNSLMPMSASQTTNKLMVNCPECDITFSSPKHLAKHRSRFWNKGNHQCPKCGRRFLWLTLMQAHLKKHSAKANSLLKYLCPHCDDKFRSSVAVYSHVIHLHGKDKLGGRHIHHVDPCASTCAETGNSAAMEGGRFEEAGTRAGIIGTKESGPIPKASQTHFMLTHFDTTLNEFSYANVRDGLTCTTCGSSFADRQTLDQHKKTAHALCEHLFNINIDKSEKTKESQQTKVSEQTNGSQQTKVSEQTNGSQQTDLSEQTD